MASPACAWGMRAKPLSLAVRRRIAVAACAAAEQMLATAQASLCDDGELQAHAAASRAATELRAVLEQPLQGGRGLSVKPRLPTLKLQKSTMYSTYVDQDLQTVSSRSAAGHRS